MRITELARRSGVKTSTIRYYERTGVLPEPERTTGGYRDYDEEDLRYVRFLRRGQRLGFTLAELAELVGFSARARKGIVAASDVTTIAASKLSELDQRISDLQRTRRAIETLLETPCIDPAAACPVIAALADSSAGTNDKGPDNRA
jgi:MerR family mercuric resistance operon transcriptional regulator